MPASGWRASFTAFRSVAREKCGRDSASSAGIFLLNRAGKQATLRLPLLQVQLSTPERRAHNTANWARLANGGI